MASTYRISTRTHPLGLARAPTAATRAKLRKAAQVSLSHQNAVRGMSICVVYSVDSYLRDLNREFSGVDVTTNVLAFPANGQDGHLGDVIISAESAVQSALRGGHETSGELQLLTVHGTLHLLGHDHGTREKRARMWQAQAEIMAQLGLSDLAPTTS